MCMSIVLLISGVCARSFLKSKNIQFRMFCNGSLAKVTLMCSFTKYYNRAISQREVAMDSANTPEASADWSIYCSFVNKAERWDAVAQRIYFRFHGNYRDNAVGGFNHDFMMDHTGTCYPF